MVFWEFFVLCTFQTVFDWRLCVVSLKNSSSYYLTIERRMGGFQKTSENKYLSEIEDSTKNGRYINQFLNLFVLRITINFNSDICSKFTSKYCNKKIAPFQRKISLFSCTWSVSEMFAILIKTFSGWKFHFWNWRRNNLSSSEIWMNYCNFSSSLGCSTNKQRKM